jgi:hypothetical protein
MKPEMINQGGLMRCCLESFYKQRYEDLPAEHEPKCGDILVCECCNIKVELDENNVWTWKDEQPRKRDVD